MDIDGTGLILGRLGTVAAKAAINGENVNIFNCSQVVITGDRKRIISEFKRKREMGTPAKGPFIHRTPSKIVKRSIRGMIPYKKSRGAEALKRVKCYSSAPKTDIKLVSIEKAHFSKIPKLKFITIKEISKELGAKLL